MKLKFTLFCVIVCLMAATVATAQDAAKVDPKHYKVEGRDAQVRFCA